MRGLLRELAVGDSVWTHTHQPNALLTSRRLASSTGMEEPKRHSNAPETAVIHAFTVYRGMSAAIVIETPDLYFGLLEPNTGLGGENPA